MGTVLLHLLSNLQEDIATGPITNLSQSQCLFVTMVLIPSISTFYISQKLGSGKFFLIGDAIEGQYVANNLHFAAAIAFVLMGILLVCMAILKYATTRHVYGGEKS